VCVCVRVCVCDKRQPINPLRGGWAWANGGRARVGHLFVEVGQPVHAFELVALEQAVEADGLRDVLAGLDGGVGQAVAVSEPGARAGGGAAAVLGLGVERPRLRGGGEMWDSSGRPVSLQMRRGERVCVCCVEHTFAW